MTMTTVPGGTEEGHAARSTAAIEKLLAATSSRHGDVDRVIDALGAARAARILVDEILFRASLESLTGRPDQNASVTIALRHRGHDHASTVSVGPDGVHVHDGSGPDERGNGALPSPVVSQDLAEAALALFGPLELLSTATRAIHWPGPEVVFPTPERPSLPTVFYAVVQRVIQVLDRHEPADLSDLAVRHGTDKWGALHQYPQHYQRHFDPRRDHRLTILEIGVGGFDDPAQGGGSMRMWKHFFPRALVYGIDILDKRQVDEPRLTTILADQSNAEELAAVAERVGPLDVVIDDGSHVSSHVLTAFRTIFPHVRRGGLYIIEDLSACYWLEHFQGSDTDLSDPAYTVGFLKTLLDGLHHEEFLRDDARDTLPTDPHISAVHVYRNLAVIEKGSNTEGSMVATLLRAERKAGH